jgi:serine/threonine protein kinase
MDTGTSTSRQSTNSATTVTEAMNVDSTVMDSAQDEEYIYGPSEFRCSVIGYGRTQVYYDSNHNIALKGLDLYKEKHILPEFQNEVKIYKVLKDLQGKVIPKMELYGYWMDAMYVIGLSLCGKVPESLTHSQKQTLIGALDAIHSHGVLHNDIKTGNILVDDKGKPYLIDFGFSTLDSDPKKQQKERDELLECMDNLLD